MYQTGIETFHPLWMVASSTQQPQHSISFPLTSASSQVQQCEICLRLYVNSAGAAVAKAADQHFCFEVVNRSHNSKFA